MRGEINFHVMLDTGDNRLRATLLLRIRRYAFDDRKVESNSNSLIDAVWSKQLIAFYVKIVSLKSYRDYCIITG